MSLPKTATEMANVEKFLHFQQDVPCQIRAKRGFATHPRSIAERVSSAWNSSWILSLLSFSKTRHDLFITTTHNLETE